MSISPQFKTFKANKRFSLPVLSKAGEVILYIKIYATLCQPPQFFSHGQRALQSDLMSLVLTFLVASVSVAYPDPGMVTSC